MDLLVAPLYGPDGELRGTLSIDCPTDGRRPDEAHRRILNRYAEQAGRALYIAVEREAFAEQVRVLSATREVVRNAARERNIGVMLEKIQPSLIAGFRSLGSWIHTFDEDGHGLGAIYAGDGAKVEMPRTWSPSPSVPPRTRGGPSGSGWCRGTSPTNPLVSQVSEPEFQAILALPRGDRRGLAAVRADGRRPGVPGQPGADPGARRRRSGPRPRSTPPSRSAATWAAPCSTPGPWTASASWSASSRRSTTTRAS